MPCPVCNCEEGRVHIAREMMFTTKEEFPYFECGRCGCLSLQNVPRDLSQYYGRDYYSFSDINISAALKLVHRLSLSPLGTLVNWLPFPLLALLPRLHLSRSVSLLDIGCGTGSLVSILRSLGYKAQGLDPYIQSDIRDVSGIRVRKQELSQVSEKFDVLLFMHSLEHMPLDTLESARKIITTNGLCVVRIPIVNWAWEHFGTNWVQLDAPRHLFLHSIRSFRLLAEKSGFRVENIVYDSVDFQLWGSEAYGNGYSYLTNPRPSFLRRTQLRIRAMALNRRGLGDQAQFYLRPI